MQKFPRGQLLETELARRFRQGTELEKKHSFGNEKIWNGNFFWQPEKPIIYGRFSLNVTGPRNSLHRTVEEFENLPAKKACMFLASEKGKLFR